MSDHVTHVSAVVVPVGTKVYDEAGNEVGEVTSWGPSNGGVVEVLARIKDPAMAAEIRRGGRQTFSMSCKIALVPAESKA